MRQRHTVIDLCNCSANNSELLDTCAELGLAAMGEFQKGRKRVIMGNASRVENKDFTNAGINGDIICPFTRAFAMHDRALSNSLPIDDVRVTCGHAEVNKTPLSNHKY
jgi:hypothetical protein